MASAAQIPGLDDELPFGIAAARVIAVRGRELLEHSRDVLEPEHPERLHDMRVAARRLRTALEFFAPCFPPGDFKAVHAQVRQIAGALGERRDGDVVLATLGRFRETLAVADRPGLDSLVAGIRAGQRDSSATVTPLVDPARLAELGDRLDELVGAAIRMTPLPDDEPAPAPAPGSEDES